MIRKVVYFSMQVPNRPGVGLQMLKAIAKGKQNLLAFTGFPNGATAQVDFVPARPVEFARGAKKAGIKLGKKKPRSSFRARTGSALWCASSTSSPRRGSTWSRWTR
jgi:hypothetical protein